MFKESLEAKFKKIFGVKKVSFSEPGPAGEQDCIFIEIQDSKNRFSKGRVNARVTGRATLFGRNEKVPFGFFSKAIERADPDDKNPFFFHEFEENKKLIQNVVEMGFSFVYFFSDEYDPDQGIINEIDIDEV